MSLPETSVELIDNLEHGLTQPFHAPCSKLKGFEDIIPPLLPSPLCRYNKYDWPPGVQDTDYATWYHMTKNGQRGFFHIKQLNRKIGGPKWEPFIVVK